MADPKGVLNNARYFPEILPFAEYRTILAASELATPLMLINRIQQQVGVGKWLRLRDIRVARLAGAEVRARADDISLALDALSLRTITDDEPTATDLLAKDFTQLTLANLTGAGIANYGIQFTVAAQQATIADKLAFNPGMSPSEVLTPWELELAEKRNIIQAVSKGTLPTNLNFRLGSPRDPGGRFYPVISKETRGETIAALVAGSRGTIARLIPRTGEILVLVEVGADVDPAVANNTRMYVTRDNTQDYLELFTWAMNIGTGIRCWVPALTELTVEILSAGVLVNYSARCTVLRVALTDYIRMSYGLMSPSDNPDLWEVVVGGIA